MAIPASDQQNIYITGFMGCGKTTVGTLLAHKIHWPFKDTDNMIEQKTNLSISQIFKKYNESKFRAIEKEIVSEVCQLHNHVISLGGGAVLSFENWNKISSTGFTVTLSFPPEIIYSRLTLDSERPLLNNSNNDRLEVIKKLIKKRRPFYQKTDLYLHSNSALKSSTIVDQIISHLTSKNWFNNL